MSLNTLCFTIPSSLSGRRVMTFLQDSLDCYETSNQRTERTFYDSFDWRIYSSGAQLTAEVGREEITLRLVSLSHISQKAELRVARMPRFSWDLPPCTIRTRLESLLAMRALLPIVTTLCTSRTLSVLNQDAKTLARVRIETSRIKRDRTQRDHGLPTRICVEPIKGYRKSQERVIRILRDELDLNVVNDSLLTLAARKLGREPGDYSSKLKLRLDPSDQAADATKAILRYLLQAMEANLPGLKQDLDSEFLHDFRVAVRRTRSALAQIKGMFLDEQIARFRAEFSWLGIITSPLRDLDVYLLKFDDYRAQLPPDVGDDLLPFKQFLRAHHAVEHTALVNALTAARYSKFVKDWSAFLNTDAPASSVTKDGARPVTDVAKEQVWRVYKRVRKQGKAITEASPAVDLHELRKTCKKLRYLMEFFQSLYPLATIKALIKTLKILQDYLGDFQDLDVQIHALKTFSEQMMSEEKVEAVTLLAMGMLVDGLEHRKREARIAFSERFATFTQPEVHHRFKELFASVSRADECP